MSLYLRRQLIRLADDSLVTVHRRCTKQKAHGVREAAPGPLASSCLGSGQLRMGCPEPAGPLPQRACPAQQP